MPRALWKGAIAFGLVNIPVSLYPGVRAHDLDLDLLDKRDFAPVGYQRVNKRSGETVSQDNLVKGYQYAKGEYVVVNDEDFKQANVKATQTVEIQAFVDGTRIAPCYFDTPYYLEPGKRGEKGYALLRETLRRTGRFGVATVVIRTRQHLAVVIPIDKLLVLNTLRFVDEMRAISELNLPSDNLKRLGVAQREIEMAERLVAEMTEEWKPERYRDSYRADLLARIESKVKSGQTHVLTAPDKAKAPRGGAQVIDLMAMLKRSLDVKRPARPAHTERAPKRSTATRASSAGHRRAHVSTERRRRRG